MEILHLAGALMEHFLEGSDPLRLWKLKLRREDLYLLPFSFGLMYQCLNGAIPSRKCSIKADLLNAKPQFMSLRRSAIKEVNDWALSDPKGSA